jgi:hypothetical protein
MQILPETDVADRHWLSVLDSGALAGRPRLRVLRTPGHADIRHMRHLRPHRRAVPGLDEQRRPTCRSCSGISLPLDCLRCGAEGQLYRAGTCIRCALGDDVHLLLGGPKGIIPTPLLPLAEAIKTMPSARSGITWLQSPKVKGLLPGGSRPIVGQVRWALLSARTALPKATPLRVDTGGMA